MAVFGNGECLSCGRRYQLPASAGDQTFAGQFCGGVLVASARTAPLFQPKPAAVASEKEGARDASTAAIRLRLPDRNWWPLLALWSLAGVFLLLLGGLVWRSSAHQGNSSNDAPVETGDLVLLSERLRERDVDVSRPTPKQNVLPPGTEPATDSVPLDPLAPPARPAEEQSPSGDTDPRSPPAEPNPDSKPPAAEFEPPRITPRRDLPEDAMAGNAASGPGLFPFTFSLTDIDGKKLDLKTLQGSVVIVDLWGTWCPPCRKEIPNFVRLKAKYGRDGLEIVGVNFERTAKSQGEALRLVRKTHSQLKMNYRCVIGTDEVEQQVPDLRGFPTTLILDRQGEVRVKLVGYRSYEDLEEIVKPLLGTNEK